MYNIPTASMEVLDWLVGVLKMKEDWKCAMDIIGEPCAAAADIGGVQVCPVSSVGN